METNELEDALELVHEKLAEVGDLLLPFMSLLTKQERKVIARAPKSFESAGRSLARRAANSPTLAQAATFDPAKVIEALDKLELLQSLETEVAHLRERVADARLTWTADAYVPSLRLYGVATVVARTDAQAAHLIEPMVSCFRESRRRKKLPKRVAHADDGAQPQPLVEPQPAPGKL